MKNPEEMAREMFFRREEHRKRNEEKREQFNRAYARFTNIVCVLVMVMTIGMGIALAAAFDIADPFHAGDFFRSVLSIRKNTTPPIIETTVPVEIEEPAAAMGESVTKDGFTVTVKSAITDGAISCITVDIIAPAEQVIASLPLAFNMQFKKLRLEGQEKEEIYGGGTEFRVIADNDGQDNTTSVLISYALYPKPGSKFTLADGRKRTLQLQNLYYNEPEYPFSRCTLTGAKWKFEVVFTPVGDTGVELLAAPISSYHILASGQKVYSYITSIQLNGISTKVYYSLPPNGAQGTGYWETGFWGTLKFVMKNGSVINAYPQRTGYDKSGIYTAYIHDSPIIYEEIEKMYVGEDEIAVAIQ